MPRTRDASSHTVESGDRAALFLRLVSSRIVRICRIRVHVQSVTHREMIACKLNI